MSEASGTPPSGTPSNSDDEDLVLIGEESDEECVLHPETMSDTASDDQTPYASSNAPSSSGDGSTSEEEEEVDHSLPYPFRFEQSVQLLFSQTPRPKRYSFPYTYKRVKSKASVPKPTSGRTAGERAPYGLLLLSCGVALAALCYQVYRLTLAHAPPINPSSSGYLGWMGRTSVTLAISLPIIPHLPLPIPILRKAYHLIAALIFLPAALSFPSTLSALSSIMILIFLSLEVIRVLGPTPLSTFIHTLIRSVVDDKDNGRWILSHIYLLGGCILPVFLTLLSPPPYPSYLLSPLGIWMITIGDTMACVGGVYWGRNQWRKLCGHPNSLQKTLEGTVVGIGATVGVAGGFLWGMGIGQIGPILAAYAVVIILTMMVEATSAEFDNLELPLVAFTLAKLLLPLAVRT